MTQSMIINENFSKLKSRKRDIFQKYEIGDDSAIYNELEAMKRSTFDLSKFTVVGSPTITDNGIASGFGTGAGDVTFKGRVEFPVNIQNTSNFIGIKGKFTTGDDVQQVQVIFCTGKYSSFIIREGKLFGALSSDGTSNNILAPRAFNYTISPNTDYWFDWVFDGTSYKVYMSTDNKNYQEVLITNSTSSIIAEKFLFGTGGSNVALKQNQFRGSIDLFELDITINNIHVLKHGLRGVDQIKKDDYTIVGSPTITDDGIASGFGSENYLDINTIDFSSCNAFAIEFSIKTGELHTVQYILGNSSNADFTFGIWNTYFFLWANTTGHINITGNLKSHTDYNIKIVYERPTLKVYIDGILNSTVDLTDNVSSLNRIGRGNSTSRYFLGSIDLNAFKIYVDDNLVYQPTLRIPYTQSKTGEKIVDAVYRDRVQDMYEQFGYTHYYTIGDEPEKYNVGVIGNPTLVGGVASGFSANNRLSVSNVNISGNNWNITTKVFVPQDVSSVIYGSAVDSNTARKSIQLAVFGTYAWAYLGDGTNGQQFNINGIVQNAINYIRIGRKDNKYFIQISQDGLNYIQQQVDVQYNVNISNISFIGGANQSWQGSIDLSQFSIEVDGKEVFRGYEPAITDAYTLQTVPNEKIVDSYYADNSFMELTADLSLTQAGGAVSGQTVNLKRPYKDNKYISTIGTTSKATNSFVASASGQWITKGKGVLG